MSKSIVRTTGSVPKEIVQAHYTGHRQRLRDRFLRLGFDGMDDYEAG